MTLMGMIVILFSFTAEEDEEAEEPLKKRRKADPKKWKKNVRKLNRVSGKEYINTLCTVIPARVFERLLL